MIFFKKLLILITVVISLIIIWKLIMIRINLKKNVEGFFDTPDSEYYYNQSSLQISLSNSNKNLHKLPLREICIKSSYNSACSGNFITKKMLNYVINRGVRYLDLEILYVPMTPDSKTYIPVVCKTSDPTFIQLDSDWLSLDEVLINIASTAFTSPCPNYNDPLFINLRVKSNNSNVYAAIASSLDHTIKQKIYNDPNDASSQIYVNNQSFYKAKPVTKNTLLGDILGKIIISFDKTIFLNYQNYSFTCNSNSNSCYDLKNYINIENGSETLNLINNYSLISQKPLLMTKDDNLNTNVTTLTCVNPDILSKTNPSYSDYILKYGGCQIVPFRFYLNDDNLASYESFFNVNNSAFVPLSLTISYYLNQGNQGSP